MTFENKLIGDKEERAVSPVIGVILMVSITVILAAVIAAFVLDMGNTTQNAAAGFSIDQGDGDVRVTINSIDRLDSVTYSGDCSPTGPTGSSWAEDSHGGVGSTDTITTDVCTEGDTINIVGHYDGESTVIQSFSLTADAATTP